MLTPNFKKVRVFTSNSKPFDSKDFIIEGNIEGACGGGEKPFYHISSTFTGVEMHILPSMLALSLSGQKGEKHDQNSWLAGA